MRKIYALVGAVLLSLGLVSCAGAAPVATDEPTKLENSITASIQNKFVTVTGEIGKSMVVKFEAPFDVTKTVSTQVITGTGDQVLANDNVIISFNVFNATNGNPIFDEKLVGTLPVTMIPLVKANVLTGLYQSMVGVPVGSRLLVLMPPEEGYGAEGNAQLGIAETDNILWVIDILQRVNNSADGVSQDIDAAFPAVTLAEDGSPSVTIPAAQPSSEMRVGILKKGAGPVVAKKAHVWVQYHGVNWRTGEVFDESWGVKIADWDLSDVVAGFSEAIAGQTVGSQVVAVVPPDKGYGPMGGNEQAGIAADDTLVFVIDILGVYNY